MIEPVNCQMSIIHLFQKMDSNISQFRASISNTPLYSKADKDSEIGLGHCNCQKMEKQRAIQKDFYKNQEMLIKRALDNLQDDVNAVRLLRFMNQYLATLTKELSNQIMCSCKLKKIQQYNTLTYKINFLREQNHKFFKIIEQKSEQCQNLKEKLSTIIESHFSNNSEEIAHLQQQTKFPLRQSSVITSRVIESNSSRASEFKNNWPQLTLPFGQIGHKKYFEGPNDRCLSFHKRQILQQRSTNIIELKLDNSLRKTKIFKSS